MRISCYCDKKHNLGNCERFLFYPEKHLHVFKNDRSANVTIVFIKGNGVINTKSV